MKYVVFVVFVLSGISALLYQMIWQRALLTLYGSNVESVAMVVTAFMVGLGIGNVLLATGLIRRSFADYEAWEKQALAELLKKLRAEGVTILIVEHDMDFVMKLVDRLVVVNFGAKLVEGLPAEVRADPRVQAAYLGGAVEPEAVR